MKLILNSLFISLFFVCFSVFAKDVNTTYTVKVSGIKIGKLEWGVKIDKNNYSNKLKLKSKGLLSALYTFEGEYFSEGVVENNTLKTKKYRHFWKTRKKTKNMSLVFDNNKLKSLDQTPIEKEHLRIDVFNVEKTKDPLTSFLQIVMGENSSLVLDGRRIYNMSASYNNELKQTIIELINYSNLWADHKRSKFEKIIFEKKSEDFLPYKIFIYFDGRVFRLEKN